DSRCLHSFPTRRSSDLELRARELSNLIRRNGTGNGEARLSVNVEHPGSALLSREVRGQESHFRKGGRCQDARRSRSSALHRSLRSEEHTSELQSLAYLV